MEYLDIRKRKSQISRYYLKQLNSKNKPMISGLNQIEKEILFKSLKEGFLSLKTAQESFFKIVFQKGKKIHF
ncbi:hypothetical protein BpHYR1_045276 [Brachionus plicatilis]|uniref:Uncharacterized protein n=1 Tax=Brachionus plicatilis TaxID=10195 RepID=A0A3M7QUJ9_BRAPC|nr:hypothetical protein BpHYR1_045276 [Brachionus plicatilis]